MDRRIFLQVAAAWPLLAVPVDEPVITGLRDTSPRRSRMPGPYPGGPRSIRTESIDPDSDKVNREFVKQMLASGMKALGVRRSYVGATRRRDPVGIKVNCSGAPKICSAPEVVAGMAENLVAIGVPAKQIYVYERFETMRELWQISSREGVNTHAAETSAAHCRL